MSREKFCNVLLLEQNRKRCVRINFDPILWKGLTFFCQFVEIFGQIAQLISLDCYSSVRLKKLELGIIDSLQF